jgi:arginine dihydrolase
MSAPQPDPGPQPHILMCPPDFYGIHYEINPWMDMSRQADHAVAVDQWQSLHRHILDAGARVSQLEPVQGLPDLVFTANAAMIYRGDALFCGDTLYAGYRMRSDAAGHQQIGRMIGCRVIPVELVDARYYHLDTCFCPLAGGEAVWYPAAFDDYGRRAIREHVPMLIEADRAEAERFACNAVVIDRRVITNTGCERLHAALASRRYQPVATPLDEFVKAGGSAKCLTLRLDGENAAAWRE